MHTAGSERVVSAGMDRYDKDAHVVSDEVANRGGGERYSELFDLWD